MDALLFFGNVRTGFRNLRDLKRTDLEEVFSSKRFDTDAIKRRGPSLQLSMIARDDRYLISEMACKSYGEVPDNGDLYAVLSASYNAHVAAGKKLVTFRQLLENEIPKDYENRQGEFMFSADDVLNDTVSSELELKEKYSRLAEKFGKARNTALENTEYYLSMLGDLDIYVATSMRKRDDFRKMASFCENVFKRQELESLNLRYFDPTLSAASGHEDKGLIECLMVKCAKMLVYCAGDKKSYGKDAEAAMALSLGKPVIFYCADEERARFYRDVHPLSRLIQFETGIPVGAMVTTKPDDVSELIIRTFENRMIYELDRSGAGALRLKDKLTGSVVRLQSGDQLLTEAFWNHYHQGQNRR